MLKIVLFVVALTLRESAALGDSDTHLRAHLRLNEMSNRLEGQCFRDIKSVMRLVAMEDESAMQMISAWSSFPTTHTHGNSYDFGQFEACRTLQVDSIMRTRYCLVQYSYKSSRDVIAVPPNASFTNVQWRDLDRRFGGAICVPESCSDGDVVKIISGFFNGSELVYAGDYEQGNFCKGARDEIDWGLVAVIVTIEAIIIPAGLLATLLDIRHRRDPKSSLLSPSFVKCFSLRRTYKDLMSEKSSIACLNGIKAISIFVIMLYHSLQFRLLFPFGSGEQLSSWINGNVMKFVGALTIPVDAFLLISGALVTRSIVRDLESGKLNLVKLYIQRYFRLTPVAVLVMLFSLFSAELLYHFAPYSYRGDLSDGCRKHWLMALLHLQIYTNPDEMCVPYTWYLSVDWHMFLVAPLLIYIAWKIPYKNLVVGNFLVLVSAFIVARFLAITHFGFKPEDLAVQHSIKSNIEYFFYYPTHIRGLPFLIGLMLGHFLKEEKLSFGDKTLTKAIMRFSLVMSVAFILVYPIPLEHFSGLISPHFELILFTFGKLLWSLAVAVVILTCHHGYGGIVNRILSLRIWSPIAKMSLSFYLMSAGITYILVVAQKTPLDIRTGFSFALTYVLDVSVATLIATFSYFFVESPFIQIGRLVAQKLS